MKRLALLLASLAAAVALRADDATVTVPIVDVPWATEAPQVAPSMQQSLGLTAAFYELSHDVLGDALEKHPLLAKLSIAAYDITFTEIAPLPLTDGWLHEEWHRAILGRRGLSSYNDIYRFRVGAESVAVSHVRDEDLVKLKRDHPAELIRLDAAGVEGETQLVERLEKEQFFSDARGWHLAIYWLSKFDVQAYIGSGTSQENEDDTNQANRDDGTDVPRRDFTGHDFSGWVYDLFRPDEPYTARGVHPSGVGIDRYRKPSDLTPEEQRYLDRQGRLSYINFLDANLIGHHGFHGPAGVAWNVTGSHYLTSFGNTIDANVFLRNGAHKLFVVVHRYSNRANAFPGVDAQLIDEPFVLFGRTVHVTPRAAVWSQPARQRFDDGDAKTGGLAALRVTTALHGRTAAFAEVEGKTAGWVAGNEYLSRNVAVRFGISVGLR